MAECKNCIHIGVCGKLIFCERDGTVACDDYKDRSNLAEVVRCKDCKQYEYIVYDYGRCRKTMLLIKNDDFCSYGERREGE